MIYFIQRTSGGDIKIGTTFRLTIRFKQLEKEHGCSLVVLGVMDGSFADENALHRKFSCIRQVSGEWFRPMSELMSFIAENASPWDGSDEACLADFASIKVDREVLNLVRAAASLSGGQLMQEWASDVLNEAAAKIVGRKPISRKPAPPSRKRGRQSSE